MFDDDSSDSDFSLEEKIGEIRESLRYIENYVASTLNEAKNITLAFSRNELFLSKNLGDSFKSQQEIIEGLSSQLKNIDRAVQNIGQVVADLNLSEFSDNSSDKQAIVDSFTWSVRKLFLEVMRQAFLCRFGKLDFSINKVVMANFFLLLCLVAYLGAFSYATIQRLNRLEYRMNRSVPGQLR